MTNFSDLQQLEIIISNKFEHIKNEYSLIKTSDELILFLDHYKISADYLYFFKNSGSLKYYEDIQTFIEYNFGFKYKEKVKATHGEQYHLELLYDKKISEELESLLKFMNFEIVKDQVINDSNNEIKVNNLTYTDYEKEMINNLGMGTQNVIFYFKNSNSKIYLGATQNEYSFSNNLYNFGFYYKVEQRERITVYWEQID